MNPPIYTQTPPPFPTSTTPPGQKKPFPIAAVILGIVGLLFVLAVLGGVKLFFGVKESSAAAITVGNEFIDATGKHDFKKAYSLFVPKVRETTAEDSLQDMEMLVEKHHGTYVAHGEPQWHIQNNNGTVSVSLLYPAKFSKGTSNVSMTLLQTDKGYQVYNAHFDF